MVKPDSMADLMRLGTLTRQAARFLEASAAGLNDMVAGGPQTGGKLQSMRWSSAVPSG